MRADGTTTIPCPLRSAALASPAAPAIIGAAGTITYAELDRRVSSAAEEIGDRDLGEGARVALYLPKSAGHIVLLYALTRAGCVAAPLSTRLPLRSAAALAGRAGCRTVISDDAALLAAGMEWLHPGVLLSDSGEHPPASAAELRLPLQRPATLVFTSGSTGNPKAALHTLGNHYWSASGSNANISLGVGDRWLHSLPLYHVGGLSILFRCLLSGAAVALPRPQAALGEAISRSGATHVSLVSTQLLRLLREENFDAARLQAILLGGGPMPVSLLEEAAGRGWPVHASYGLTEMASQVTATRPGALCEELRTSGRALPHREVEISPRGEILVRGETLFAGYLDGEAVTRPIDAAGWFHTRDLGDLDSAGRLRVRGRMDNLFVSGGENIQPEEIEEALCRLEGVEEAAVVPVPDAEFGHRPTAFVRTGGRPVRSEELARSLERTLPRYKIPISFHRWPEGTGGIKADRAGLRERARRLHSERLG